MAQEMVFVDPNVPMATFKDTAEGPVFALDKNTEIPVFAEAGMGMENNIFCNLIQPGSVQKNQELAPHVGKFRIEELDTSRDKLRLLPIAVLARGRSLRPPYDPDSDNAPICKSSNGLTPAESVDSPISEECGRWVQKNGREYFQPLCPKAEWVDSKKPECSEWVMVAFYDLEMQCPICMMFRGTSISAWNTFCKAYSKQKYIARLKKQSVQDFVIEVSTKNKGTYYLMDFKFHEDKDVNSAAYAPLLAYYQSKLVYTPQDEDEGADSDASETSRVESVDLGDDDDNEEGEAISI